MAARIRIGNQTAYSSGSVMLPFEYAVANGFDAFEWFPDKKESGAGWAEDDISAEMRFEIRDAAVKNDIALSVHASSAANPLTEEGRNLFARQIVFAKEIGASLVNTHLYNGDMHRYAEAVLPFIRELAYDGIRISFENTVYTSPDDLNEFFKQLRESGIANAGNTGICLDLGHANLHSTTLNNYIRFMDLIDPEIPIIHIHMHENYGDSDSHLTIFTGPAAKDPSGISALLDRLNRRHFEGCIILEQWPWPQELLKQARSRLLEIINQLPAVAPASDIPSRGRESEVAAQSEGIAKRDALKKSVQTETIPPDDPVLREFADADRNFRSWRSKLNWISDFLTSRSDEPALDELVYTAIYLRFIGTGQVPCIEEGGHHRPSHHARTAQKIFERLSQITTPESAFIIRKIYPWLPSFDSPFMRAEPLTHIRDIAHRNDIPGELKKEIKETLQNKLHRSAGPEDLVTSAALLKRITAPEASYSAAFVEEFVMFHEELKEFFNAQGIDDRLNSILKKAEEGRLLNSESHGIKQLTDKTANSIKDFLAAKEHADDAAGALAALHHLISARVRLNELPAVMENGGAEAQQLVLADSGLEDFSFVLLSRLVNFFTDSGENPDWTAALRALRLNIEDLRISGFDAAECRAVESEIRTWSRDFDFRVRNHLLRLKATLERCRRMADGYAYKILSLFPDKAANLGHALGVAEDALKVYAEADVRSHPVFQLSKLVALLIKNIRTKAALPEWDAIVPGRISGKLIRAENFRGLARTQDGPAVAFIDKAEGDEEIPPGIKGVIVANEIPHLSHLAVRARQGNVVFAACEDRSTLSKAEELIGRYITLDVSAGNVTLDLAASTEEKSEAPTANKASVKVPDVILSTDRAALTLNEVTPNNGGNKAFRARQLTEISARKGPDFKTPAGIVIPFGVMEEALKEVPAVKKEYDELAGKLNDLDEEAFSAALIRLREIVKGLQVPDNILFKVASIFGDNLLIIRSSSNCEDIEGFSGAGLYDSIANIPGADIAGAVRRVWASLWNGRAVAARKAGGIPHHKALMAVLIQQLIVPEYSFIIHTVNPLTLEKDEVYVELAAGLGETLASGQIPGNPYRMVCSKRDGTLKMLSFASFSHSLMPGSAGRIMHRTIDYSGIRLSVDTSFREKIGALLTKIAASVEESTGMAQDIEGVVHDGEIYLVQTRPQQGLA